MSGKPTTATPGTLPDPSQLVDVPRLMTAYYTRHPDVAVAAERVAFGTSGHRGWPRRIRTARRYRRLARMRSDVTLRASRPRSRSRSSIDSRIDSHTRGTVPRRVGFSERRSALNERLLE